MFRLHFESAVVSFRIACITALSLGVALARALLTLVDGKDAPAKPADPLRLHRSR